MVLQTVAVAVLAILTASACAEVDFTPKASFYLAEGTKAPNITFHNGGKAITYSPPGNWTLSGGGRKLTLTPLDKVQASATMQTAPVKEQLPATEENLKGYSEIAVSRLPAEASKVTVVESTICPMRISDKTMAEVTLSYVLYGQQFTSMTLYLPADKEQITFQVTARSADFAPLAKVFRKSLYSLQGL